MIPHATGRKLELTDVHIIGDVTIDPENIPNIFQIVVSQIYSNKVDAVIRESSTNGQDAHIFAGCPERPIDVTLPTVLSPEFHVRDYGLGMSEATVRDVYVKLGSSTKRDSNDMQGNLGVGAKAPFAYVDNFYVTSYQAGVKTLYEIFIDDDGGGKLAKHYEEPTSEDDGVEVMVPVQPSDVYTFTNRAKSVYQWFSPIPNFLGGNNLRANIEQAREKALRDAVYSSADWSVRFNYLPSVVVMGNITYPLTTTPFTDEYAQYAPLATAGLVLHVPIGEVSHVASREALEYNPRTIEYLQNKIKEIIDSIVLNCQTSIDSAKSMWEARYLMGKYRALPDWMQTIAKAKVFTFRGEPVPNCYVNMTALKKFGVDNNIQFREYAWRKGRLASGGAVTNTFSGRKVESIIVSQNMVFLLDTKTTKRNQMQARIRAIFDAEGAKTLIYVRLPDAESANLFLENPEFIGANVKYMTDAVLPDMPVRNAVVKKVSSKPAGNVLEFTGFVRNADPMMSWRFTTMDMNTSAGVYVLVNRYQPMNTEGWMSHGDGRATLDALSGILHVLSSLDIPVPVVYGIRQGQASKLGSNWKSLQQYVQEAAEKIASDVDFANWVEMRGVSNAVPHMYAYDLAPIRYMFSAEGRFYRYLEVCDAFRINDKSQLALLAFCERYGVTVKGQTPRDNLNAMTIEVEKHYPMLGSIRSWIDNIIWDTKSPVVQDFVRYIAAIDELDKTRDKAKAMSTRYKTQGDVAAYVA